MEDNNIQDPEQQMMMFSEKSTVEIDPRRSRFPYCVVWTPLPVISWIIPFIGHVGICREDGVILDFAGPNFVSVDNFAFGAVARFIQIKKNKECTNTCGVDDELNGGDALSWDNALRKSTQEFQHHSYSLFTCNCHSFVCNNLNRLGFRSGGWNVVNLAALMFLKGQWVSTGAMVRSYLPFVIVCCLGVLLGGFKFLGFVAFVALALVGWFIFGTYFFNNLIQL